MIEDIRDWVMARDTPLMLANVGACRRLLWHGVGVLQFDDGLHYYRIIEDTTRVSVALIEGFERWGPSTAYYMAQLPYSKEALMKLVRICQHLTENIEVPEGEELGPLDIGPVCEIDTTGLSRVEVLQRVERHLFTEVRSWVLGKGEAALHNIESLVDIVMGEV